MAKLLERLDPPKEPEDHPAEVFPLPEARADRSVDFFPEADCRIIVMTLANSPHSSSQFLDIHKPLYSDSSKKELPLQFIKSFENFYEVNHVDVGQRLVLVKACLKDSVADWVLINDGWENYDQFKSDFLSYFWSKDKQMSWKTIFCQSKFVPHKKVCHSILLSK